MISSQITSFLRQAKLTANISNKPAETISITAVIITPKKQIMSLGVERLTEVSDFVGNRSDIIKILLRLQPGVYMDQIVPYRDNLEIKLILRSDTDSILREYVAIPKVDKDIRAENNNSKILNLNAIDQVQLVSYEFQLVDKGFQKLSTVEVSETLLITKVDTVIKTVMNSYSRSLKMTGPEEYKDLMFYTPIDNLDTKRQIIIPAGIKLINVPLYLQNDDVNGVYSKGLGCYYKQNYWWVYPLFNTNLVDLHPRPIDLIRVPEDKIPDLDHTFYINDNALTIIAAGKSSHKDNADIRKQNQGIGQRLIMGDSIAGDTGSHYNNGRAITTRVDTLTEYKLSSRGSGEEFIPLNRSPTSNICKHMSENSINEGEFLTVEWRNGDTGYLQPGHPIRFQYMENDNSMVLRKGVLLGMRTDYLPISNNPNIPLKRTTILTIFIKRQEQYKV